MLKEVKRLIEVRQLTKQYGNKWQRNLVLNHLNFTVNDGEFVGVMGPSGAGKTTLLNILSAIDRPTSGEVLVAGQNVQKLSDNQLSDFRKKTMGFIFQEFNLLESLSVKDNILLPLALEKMTWDDMQERLERVSKNLGISYILERYPSEISIGQKQRTAAARALIVEPKVILADEPTGSLDSKSATELLEYLRTLNQREQVTLLMVTHDAFAASYCDRIIFIKDGMIFSELTRGQTRKEFFQKIIDVQATMGGGSQHEFL